MIKVTRLNDSQMMVNVEKIQSVESTPDTVITFTNNDKVIVKDSVEELSQRILDYMRAVRTYAPLEVGILGDFARTIN